MSSAAGLTATHWHKDAGQWLLIALVVLHLCAIAFCKLLRGHNLVPAMITGDKTLPADVPASTDSPAPRRGRGGAGVVPGGGGVGVASGWVSATMSPQR